MCGCSLRGGGGLGWRPPERDERFGCRRPGSGGNVRLGEGRWWAGRGGFGEEGGRFGEEGGRFGAGGGRFGAGSGFGVGVGRGGLRAGRGGLRAGRGGVGAGGGGNSRSMHCSMMFLRVKIWSMHPRPLLNPACSCLSLVSILAASILPRRILQKTLDGIESSVMPRQLSQFWRLPFLGILTIKPLFLSSFSQIFMKRSVSTLIG